MRQTTIYDREKLYEEVWTEPMSQLADRYGVSGVAPAKMCRELGVPVSGRGYWTRKHAGTRVGKRPDLPPVFGATASLEPEPAC